MSLFLGMSHSISPAEKDFCCKLVHKLMNSPICKEFVLPVDPNESYADDYFKIIARPMDLTKVLNKLNDNKYTNVVSFEDDLNLIWQNAMTFNRKPSPLYYVADFLQKKCAKKLSKVPATEQDVIYLRLQKLNNQMKELLEFELPEYSMVQRIDYMKEEC